ncbi:hypothetical protein GQ600_823 [Phytophthora cactorum]|nr:hypothetical protein GQ600_823 [Phytophthora cactorum]
MAVIVSRRTPVRVAITCKKTTTTETSMSNEDPLSTTAVAQRAASIKGLKRKWAEYCSELSSTGNNADKPIVEPTCLALMEEFWSRGTGMQGDTLADNDTTRDLLDSDSDDDTRTVAEGLEIGMKAMSSGFHVVASAISSQQSTINSAPPKRLESVMEARFATVIDQLQTQSNNLAALVEFLRKQ